jgi:hypothetical protein
MKASKEKIIKESIMNLPGRFMKREFVVSL